MISLADRLRELREGKGFRSHKQFSIAAEVQGRQMSAFRYGAIERVDGKPSLEEIVLICRVLGISADAWLFGDESGIVLRELRSEEKMFLLGSIKLLTNMRQ